MARSRSRFDHLVVELSTEVGALIPRYPLWLRLHELGHDPERLHRESAVAFCERHLVRFLADHGYWLSLRARRRLVRSIARFDPERPTPADAFASSQPDG